MSVKGLNKHRIDLLLVPISFTIAHLTVAIFILKLSMNLGLLFGYWFSYIILVIIKERREKYIYNYSIDNELIEIYVVSAFGKKNIIQIPIHQLEKLKYRKKTFWRKYDMVWVHLVDSVKEYQFLERNFGDKLIDNIDVEKI